MSFCHKKFELLTVIVNINCVRAGQMNENFAKFYALSWKFRIKGNGSHSQVPKISSIVTKDDISAIYA